MIKSYKDYLTEAEQSLGPQPGDYLHLITEDGVTSIQLDEVYGAALRAIFLKSPKQLAKLFKWPLDKAKKFWTKYRGTLGLGVGAGAGALVGSMGSGGGDSGNAFKIGYDIASKQFVGSNPLVETLNKDIQTNYPQNISHFVLDLR
jgi:hypothetical protein